MVKNTERNLKKISFLLFGRKKICNFFLIFLHLNIVTEIVSRNKKVREETKEKMKELKHESFLGKAEQGKELVAVMPDIE